MSAAGTELATVDRELGALTPLPRDNGELVFEEPWQGRALGMAVVVLERTGLSWADFRRHLVTAIASRPAAPESPATAYYGAWLDALESLVTEHRLLDEPRTTSTAG